MAEESTLDKSLRKFKTHLSTYPNKQLAALMRGYVLPIMEEMRFEYSDAFSYIEDRVDSLDEGVDTELLEKSKRTILVLSALLDDVLQRAGWIKDDAFSADFPEDLRAVFKQATAQVIELLQEISEATSDDEDSSDDSSDASAGGV